MTRENWQTLIQGRVSKLQVSKNLSKTFCFYAGEPYIGPRNPENGTHSSLKVMGLAYAAFMQNPQYLVL